jgi:hypothetical protein
MGTNIVYIDDSDIELKKYESKFTSDPRSTDKFTVKTFNTPKKPDEYTKILDANPELLLIDYNLDDPENGEVIGISGSALSTDLKQKAPDVPIVLFTRKQVFNTQNYADTKDRLSKVIDQIMYKQDLFKKDSTALEEITRLANGYRILRDQKAITWDKVLELIGASTGDAFAIEQTNPPFTDKKGVSVTSTAVWIRDILLRYPGITYNSIHAATYLGISEEAFSSEVIKNTFLKAKYTGIFAPIEGYWWKSKLQEIAFSFMNKKERSLSIRDAFPKSWERNNKTVIQQSKCIFSGESPAEWVCCILQKPVMLKYTLSYSLDNRPTVMDEAKISFEAIRTTNDWEEKRIDSIGRSLLPKILKMTKPGA